MKKSTSFIKPTLFFTGTACTAYFIFSISSFSIASDSDDSPNPNKLPRIEERTDRLIKAGNPKEDQAYEELEVSHKKKPELGLSEPIRLVATFVSNDSAFSWAFFEKDGTLFLIAQEGHKMIDGFFIYKIQNDQVLIKKNTTIKSIKLTSSKSSEVYGGANITSSEEDGSNEGEEAPSPRRQILNQLSLKPVSDSSPSGYRVTEDSFRLIKQHGLKPGDIILSVNGHPLGTESSDTLAVKSFQKDNKASVAVLRDSQTIYIDYTP